MTLQCTTTKFLDSDAFKLSGVHPRRPIPKSCCNQPAATVSGHEQPSCSREWPRSELEGFCSSKTGRQCAVGPRRSAVLEGLINPSLRHRKSAAHIRNPPNTSPRVSREGHKSSANGGWSTCSNHDRRRCAGAVGAASLQTKIIPRRRPIAECTVGCSCGRQQGELHHGHHCVLIVLLLKLMRAG